MTRRLVIDPLTRVEGHGRVELALDGNRLVEVRLRLLESPRLFEALLVGRRFDEVPELICRICAICSAVHKLTALRAVEAALHVEVPELAKSLRELLLIGGHVQSHALHLFCLILPDFDRQQSVVPLLKRRDRLAEQGLALKAYGNRIQEVVGGRVIHPVNPVVGGMSYRPQQGQLRELLTETEGWLRDWPELAAEFGSRSNWPLAATAVGAPLAVAPDDGFGLSGERLFYGSGHSVAVGDYAGLLDEQTVADSHARESAGEEGPFLVGALARLQVAAKRQPAMGFSLERDDIHANNLAQLKELEWSLQRIRALLDKLLIAGEGGALKVRVTAGAGNGTAAMEAPRGLLVHHYLFDEWGKVVKADVVTPTAINQRVIAKQLIKDLAIVEQTDQLVMVAERVVRAYDPCISCAVHLCPVGCS